MLVIYTAFRMQQFVNYRNLRRDLPSLGESYDDGLITETSAEAESVLDGLVSIMLSQNTTDANSRKAFLSLKSAFPHCEDRRRTSCPLYCSLGFYLPELNCAVYVDYFVDLDAFTWR